MPPLIRTSAPLAASRSDSLARVPAVGRIGKTMPNRPKPYRLKVLAGNPVKRPLNPGPDFQPVKARMPAGMGRHAKRKPDSRTLEVVGSFPREPKLVVDINVSSQGLAAIIGSGKTNAKTA